MRQTLLDFSGATGDTYAPLCHERIKELGLRSAKLDLDPYFLRASKNNFDVKEVRESDGMVSRSVPSVYQGNHREGPNAEPSAFH